ncbi:MAG: triose-phosphate isomerase [Betaproteobacteria bacterium]|nr:MAG: triose-phosphate isomerase [Betaproteobacteria bacterium]
MRERWVIGNWKMNGTLQRNRELLDALKALAPTRARIAVCVPSVFLPQTAELLAGTAIAWGAQDVSAQPNGAYTGQISSSMLQEFGASVAIVGHSERRLFNAESNEDVAKKALAAANAGLRPVVCVGESLAEREAGRAEAVVGAQLAACTEALARFPALPVIAYEPVWAIGTGKTASPEQAEAMHAFLRSELANISPEARQVPILYGGSVKPSNAAELFAQPNIDGGLIGGASLVAADFLAIAAA